MESIVNFTIISLLFLALIPAFIASSKGRNGLLWYIYGFFLFLFAFIHALVLKPNANASGMRKCPKCASVISKEAIICPSCREHLDVENNSPKGFIVANPPSQEILFDGERNIASDAYQLFLTKRFVIEKNATLEKFVIGNDVFGTLDDTLREADERYGRHLSFLIEEEEKANRDALELEEKNAFQNAQYVERMAKEKARRDELEAKLALIREANRKKLLIIGVTIGVISIVGLSLYGFNKHAEDQRLAKIKLNDEKIAADQAAATKIENDKLDALMNAELVEMFSTSKFFGYEIGANNLAELFKAHPKTTFKELGEIGVERGEYQVYCYRHGCDSLVGNSSLATNEFLYINFLYCIPDRPKGNSIDKYDRKNYILTGVTIRFIEGYSKHSEIEKMLIEAGVEEKWSLSDASQKISNNDHGLGLHRKKNGDGVKDICGNKWSYHIDKK